MYGTGSGSYSFAGFAISGGETPDCDTIQLISYLIVLNLHNL
jgi:hypothetical protein